MSAITAAFTSGGALAELAAGPLSLLLYPATELEAGPCQLWLRIRGADGVRPHPLTGPASGSEASRGCVRGTFEQVEYEAWFDVVGSGYCWQWRVRNLGDSEVAVDVLFCQDVALTPLADVRRNEYYVSQYLDLTPLRTEAGTALAVRQNMPDTANPWLALASLSGTASWATDAQQLRAGEGGLDLTRDLPGERLQHEHTLAALQAPAVTLAPGGSASGGFVGVFVAHHPAATGPADAAVVDAYLEAGGWPAQPRPTHGTRATASVFAPALPLAVREATWADVEARLPGERRHGEHGPDGAPWSAFVADAHVVTRAKEAAVLRPHGHVMHLGESAEASGTDVASTVWMDGVFCSQLTRGHASGAPGVTLRRSYAGLSLAGGVRMAVRSAEGDGGGGSWRLLGRPSLWVQRGLECRWHYLTDAGEVVVTAGFGASEPPQSQEPGPHGVRLDVTCTPPLDVLVAVGEDHDGVRLDSDAGDFGDDAALFADGRSRGLRWRCLVAESTGGLAVTIRNAGDGESARSAHAWRRPGLFSDAPGVAEVDDTLEWFVHDAAVHFQAPRGLEQFTGGAWGTRDVSQGPVGLLIAAGEHEALRTTMLAVFAGQADDGDWPQWFDYLPGAAAPGHRDSHGDVVYWPLLALGEYLLTTGDAGVLDEPVRWVGRDAFGAPTPLLDHVRRAVDRLAGRRTSDDRLPAYGHGDWNDSLQPARPELAEQMCSAWTTVLEIEALRTLRAGLGGVQSPDAGLAARLEALATGAEAGLREVLLADGELAGYAIVADETELLVHPRDRRTGLAHGSLQVIHAIAGELLTLQEARDHVRVIDEHLDGPHGLYLFDAPVAYAGGELRVFKRAEAATFWGREIGLMYTHAHLRWIAALTHLGDAERAWAELLKVVPVGVRERVPGARPRQATCYYSSADAAFPDRYAAVERAAELFDPATPYEGGWRVYSSGPGLVLRLLAERVLGVRFRAAGVEVDPVLPRALDGLVARVPTPGSGYAEVTYRVGKRGHGVVRVLVDGEPARARMLTARYREPGVRLAPDAIRAGSRVEVELG